MFRNQKKKIVDQPTTISSDHTTDKTILLYPEALRKMCNVEIYISTFVNYKKLNIFYYSFNLNSSSNPIIQNLGHYLYKLFCHKVLEEVKNKEIK